MVLAEISRSGELAVVTLARGKVNALTHDGVLELDRAFRDLEADDAVRGIILTGRGKFFTFGFDIPEFLSWSKEDFRIYLTDFTALYTRIFRCSKPVVAALNGHTIAGGCMLALACDMRLMASGSGKISLNEITFGASVFAGCVEMLRSVAGGRNAEKILLSGAMYTAVEAVSLGLVDRACDGDELMDLALSEGRAMATMDATAFAAIKRLNREPIAEEMRRGEPDSIREFADIWYSEATRHRLEQIKIRKG